MRLAVSAALLLVCAGSVAAQPITPNWSFTLECRSSLNPSIPPLNLPFPSSLSSQSPAIADRGDIVVRVILSNAEGVFGGLAGTGAGALILTEPSAGDPVFSSDIDLRGNEFTTTRIFTNERVETRSLTTGAVTRSFGLGGTEGITGSFGRARIIPDGVGYRASSGTSRKFVIDRVINTVRVQTGLASDAPGSAYSFLYSPTTNAALQMGARVDLTAGGSQIVRFQAGDAPVTLFATDAAFDRISNLTDMNDAGTMAFFARSAATQQFTLFRSAASGAQVAIATAGQLGIQNGTFANFPPAIAGSLSGEWVAFRARDAAGDAIFIGNGVTLRRLIGFGDTIQTDLGPTTLGFDFGGGNRQALSGSIDINARGQIAFGVVLASGQIGIMSASPCFADFTADGTIDINDFFAYLSAYSANSPRADFTADGALDINDFFAFLAAYSEGC